MASGFIILPDGRCFAPMWSIYDKVIEAIVNVLSDTSNEKELKTWLISILPAPATGVSHDNGSVGNLCLHSILVKTL
jgi:hypothetical protein